MGIEDRVWMLQQKLGQGGHLLLSDPVALYLRNIEIFGFTETSVSWATAARTQVYLSDVWDFDKENGSDPVIRGGPVLPSV